MAKRKRKKRNSRLRRQRRIVLLLVIIIFVLAGTIALSGALMQKPHIETPPADPMNSADDSSTGRKDGFYTVLVCGTDDGNGGSDTIMLAAVDTEGKSINIASIPRDTLVNEDWTVKKINSAYNRGGIEAVQQQVEKIAGFPVDFYVTVDLQAFIDLVNPIDGVDFEVPINMNYDDPAQNLHIHFQAGLQHLDGQEAMEVVRFRHNNDGGGYPLQDLDRIKTQQAFLKTVADKLFSLQSVIKIPEFARIFFDNVKSDLALSEMVWLGNQAGEYPLHHPARRSQNRLRRFLLCVGRARLSGAVQRQFQPLQGGSDRSGSGYPRRWLSPEKESGARRTVCRPIKPRPLLLKIPSP